MKEKCIDCGTPFKESESKHEVWKYMKKTKILKGYECLKCNQKSIPDEVWENLDKYHQGI